MYKYVIVVFLFDLISCRTDQGDAIIYAINNSFIYDLKVVLYDRFGKKDTTSINKNESKVLYQEGPPYDGGPFAGYDSLRVIFEDSKILTYLPKSDSECLNGDKNPYCFYSSYRCTTDTCTFKIDGKEHDKAK